MEGFSLFEVASLNVEIEQLFDRKRREYYTVIRHHPFVEECNLEPPEDIIIYDWR